MHRLRGRLLVVAAGVAAAVGLPAAVAAPADPGVSRTPRPALTTVAGAHTTPDVSRTSYSGWTAPSQRPQVSTVTLVTGDRVRLTTRANGVRTVVPVPGPGRSGMPFGIRYHGASIQVVPADAGPLLRSGRLDPRLFDVAGLVAAGYDDAHLREIPLRLRHPSAALRSLPRGVVAGRTFGGQATKVFARKDVVTDFWRWLVGPRPARPGRPAPVAGALAAGVEKVSLRRPSRAHLGQGFGSLGHPDVGRQLPPPQADGVPATLTIRLIDRNGDLVTDLDPFILQPVVLNLDTEDVYDLQPGSTGLTVQVPPGRYSFGEIIATGYRLKPTSYTLLARPNFTVADDLTITLDARAARQAQALTEVAGANRRVVTSFGTVELFQGRPWTTLVALPGPARSPAFALPTAEVTDRTYTFAVFQSLATGNDTYDLIAGERGQVPANPTTRFAARDLSVFDAKFATSGEGVDLDGVWFREAQLPDDVMVGLGWHYEVPLPSTRRHFVGARFDGGQNLAWSDSLDVREDPWNVVYSEICPPRALEPGQRLERTWTSAAFRPLADGERQGDGYVSFALEPFAPSFIGQGYLRVHDRDGITGWASLRRGNELVAESDDPFVLDAGVQPGEPATYTLDLSATRRSSWSKYATSVRGQWVFRSGPGTGEMEPLSLMNVLATGAFDGYGRGPAGRAFTLDLPVVPGRDNGPVASVQLSVSYDDGATWQSVPVTKVADLHWQATLHHPERPGRFVSLRTTVTDTKGNRLELTSIRAYGLYRP